MNPKSNLRSAVLVLAALAVLAVPSIAAQSAAAQAAPAHAAQTLAAAVPAALAAPAPVVRESGRVALSANLLGVATANPTADIDLSLRPGLSAGATIWWEVREPEDRWAQLRLTWWPGGGFMRGFGLSATAGWHEALGDWADRDDREGSGAATAGVLAGYWRRFGPGKRITAGIQAGAKAVLPAPDGGSALEPFYGELRLTLGRVF